ncbi:MAG: hypothetical protein ACK4PI_04605 [Tepidisphaerales bacterium]
MVLREWVVAGSVLAASGVVSAGTVQLQSLPGSEGRGSFTGTLTYEASGGRSGLLRLSITNTSGGGFITAMSLLAPSGLQLSPVSGFDTFELVSLPPGAGVRGTPAAVVSWGIVLGGGALGRDPTQGVAAGSTSTFEVAVTTGATGASPGLSVDSFVAGLGGEPGFVAVMRGFDDGGSDKVPAAWARMPNDGGDPTGGGGSNPAAVPVPAAVVAGGLGLAGLLGRRRR